MKPIHESQIKALFIRWALNNEMVTVQTNDTDLIARGPYSEIHVPIEHVYNSIQQGWTAEEVFDNESGHVE